MDKRRLNYRFHNPNQPEVLECALLQICISANMKKVESAVRDCIEKESTLRIVVIDRNAQVAKLEEETLFKMPKGEYGGKYYKISNDCIKEQSAEIVLELPNDVEISLLDKMQQVCKSLSINEFIKVVVGKGEKDYEELYKLPSAIYAEQIKYNTTK